MPNLNQKVSDFLKEQQDFLDDECTEVLMALHERGHMNMKYLVDSTESKLHRIPITLGIVEAFGFVEIIISGQSKEYRLTPFGREYLTWRGLVKKEKKITEHITLDVPVIEVEEVDVELIRNMLRLILLGKYNSIAEISELLKVENHIIKELLHNLTLARIVSSQFVNKVKRYDLEPLGEKYYHFIRNQKNPTAFKRYLQAEYPVLLDTLKEVAEKGESAQQTELTYLQTLGLIVFKRKKWDISALGQLLI